MNFTRPRQARPILGQLLPRQRMCTTKRVYSKRQATAAMNNMNTHLNPGETPLNIYKCPFCRGWHCGHSGRLATNETAIN